MPGRKTALRWGSAAIAVVFAGYLAFLAQGDRRLDRGFRGVAEGATREQVIALLGPPDAVGPGCRDLPTWLNRPVAAAACAEEIEYRAKLKSVFWTIGFDEGGRAIAKYRYVER